MEKKKLSKEELIAKYVTEDDIKEADEFFSNPQTQEKIAKTIKNKVGRPKLDTEGNKQRAVRLPYYLDELLIAKAKEEHKTPSELVRDILEEKLATR